LTGLFHALASVRAARSHTCLINPSQIFHKVKVHSPRRSKRIRRALFLLGGNIMKSKLITARKITAGRVAFLVAAGLLVGTTSAHAEVAPTPAPTKTPSQYQVDRAAYKTALEAFIANREATQTQFKATMATFNAARESYHVARAAIQTTFKTELALAKTTREAAIAAATTPEAKLAANNAAKAAITAATAKRDAAVTALGAAPVKPAKPTLGTKPTPPAKPVKPTN